MRISLIAVLGALACTTPLSMSTDTPGADASGEIDTGRIDAPAPHTDAAFDAGARRDVGTDLGTLAAFPGAEGYGTETVGGRGGAVYVVRTLASSGPGSLRDALLATEPRTIVFAVSGVITLDEEIVLSEENSYVTVAGQTSPGGITLTASDGTMLSSYRSDFHDAVFRFLRFRGRGTYDNVSFNTVHHLVFDHCDFSGGSDETFDVTFASDLTVQWSTVTNSDTGGQGYGWLIAYEPTANISIHHNLSAHHRGRCAPLFHWGSGVPSDGITIDFRNNVIHNCAFDGYFYVNPDDVGPERTRLNFVGNHFSLGPSSADSPYAIVPAPGMRIYVADNLHPGFSLYGAPRGWVNVETPFDAPPVTTVAAAEVQERVLTAVGAFPRDALNERTVREVRDGTGSLGRFDDALLADTPALPADADGDWMADAWETSVGLDPAQPSDARSDRNADGYTNLEEYLHVRASELLP